jgi:hypothetical protein
MSTQISVVVSTNKPLYWQRLCESLSHNSVEFEVIFVGPLSRPVYSPPVSAGFFSVPTRFFTNNANPTLCWELGARKAKGQLLCLAPDDFIFSPHYLDDAVEAAKSMGKFDMVTGRYSIDGVDTPIEKQTMFSIPGMPLLPIGGITFTASHHELGGLDCRLKGVLWDTDLYSRFVWAGGKTIMLERHKTREESNQHNMWNRYSPDDVFVFRVLWSRIVATGQAIVPDEPRHDIVHSYQDDELTAIET